MKASGSTGKGFRVPTHGRVSDCPLQGETVPVGVSKVFDIGSEWAGGLDRVPLEVQALGREGGGATRRCRTPGWTVSPADSGQLCRQSHSGSVGGKKTELPLFSAAASNLAHQSKTKTKKRRTELCRDTALLSWRPWQWPFWAAGCGARGCGTLEAGRGSCCRQARGHRAAGRGWEALGDNSLCRKRYRSSWWWRKDRKDLTFTASKPHLHL